MTNPALPIPLPALGPPPPLPGALPAISPTLVRALVLAVLLHVWLVLLLGSAPGGTAAPGQGVWGAINVTLRGPERPGADVVPAPPVPDGPTGAGTLPRWGGSVREDAPAATDSPGAARLGDWSRAPEAGPVRPAPADLPAAPAAPAPTLPVVAAPTLPAPPSAVRPVRSEDSPRSRPPAQVPTPAPVQAVPEPSSTAGPVDPAGPVEPAPATSAAGPSPLAAAPSAAAAPEPLRLTESAPDPDATVPAVAHALPALPALPAVQAGLPSAGLPVEPLASVPHAVSAAPLAEWPAPVVERRLPTGATLANPVPTVPPLEVPAPALSPLAGLPPGTLPAPAVPRLPDPVVSRLPSAVARPAAPATPMAPLLQPGSTPTVVAPDLGGELPRPGPAPVVASGPPGAPDAGSQVGHDVATPPAPAASMPPRLNLQLARPRGGELSRLPGTGVLAVMPRPPELPDKLARDIANSAKTDCRQAYQGAGVLAVVPLAADALRKDGGCKW